MKTANKSSIKSIMEAAENAHKSSSAEIARIYADRDLSDYARLTRAEAAGNRFKNTVEGLIERIREEKEKAVKELDTVKQFNSQRRLANSEYQNRILLEGRFAREMPLSMGEYDLKERFSVFFGDELARKYLTAVVSEVSEKRKARNMTGFDVAEILPDAYDLQYKAVEKLFSAIEKKLSSISESFDFSPMGKEKNDSAAMFMQGLFTGISDYIDGLPEKIERPQEARLNGVDFENIPVYASDADDLKVNFSMYRKA